MSHTEARVVECAHCGGTGKATLPSEIAVVETYFFGCWEQSGHFWRDPTNRLYRSDEIETRLPQELRQHIDGWWCPGTIRKEREFRKTRHEVEGEAALHHVDGWTILAWWDRSVDHRGACNSNIVSKGIWDFTTMLEIGKEQLPNVMSRQRFPLRLVEESSR